MIALAPRRYELPRQHLGVSMVPTTPDFLPKGLIRQSC
jgi:hypothetical protein